MEFTTYILILTSTLTSGIELSVSPGKNLWIDENLVLTCKVDDLNDGIVWHRSTENGEEIISHADDLLIKDERFNLTVTKYEDSAIYKVKIRNVLEEDSGRYSCDSTQIENKGSYIDVGIFTPRIHQSQPWMSFHADRPPASGQRDKGTRSPDLKVISNRSPDIHTDHGDSHDPGGGGGRSTRPQADRSPDIPVIPRLLKSEYSEAESGHVSSGGHVHYSMISIIVSFTLCMKNGTT